MTYPTNDQAGLTRIKHVTVKFSGDRAPRQLEIEPGTRAIDVLEAVDLGRDYVLSRGGPEERMAPMENVYQAVGNGELLYVSSETTFG